MIELHHSTTFDLRQEFNEKLLSFHLMKIDIRIRKAIRCWQLAGQDLQDHYRGLSITDQEADCLTYQPIGTNWSFWTSMTAEENLLYSREIDEIDEKIRALSLYCKNQNISLQIEEFQGEFHLDAIDLDIFFICLAPALDLRYERLYSYLQDDITHKRPCVNLVLNLLGIQGIERLRFLSRFYQDAPLIFFHLIEFTNEPGSDAKNLIAHDMQVDPTITAWLLGQYEPRSELSSHTKILWPTDDLVDQLLPGPSEHLLFLIKDSKQNNSSNAIWVFHGKDNVGQDICAQMSAFQFGCPLLQINMEGLLKDNVISEDGIRMALRDAHLLKALPYFYGWDACPTVGEANDQFLMDVFNSFPGVIVVSGKSAWQPMEAVSDAPIFYFEFPIPDHRYRSKIWSFYLRDKNKGNINITTLANQFNLTTGQIQKAVAAACDRAAQYKREPDMNDMLFAARKYSNLHLGALTTKITPRYCWKDIILPKTQIEQLSEIVAAVKERTKVLLDWRLERKLVANKGVPIMFTGEPGTGKTMAAEIISNELGMDLYKIDLSSVINKYIGETEKNLERIFSEAENSNAILFFDEADALFGKRSEVKDAHDRYANIETSYLLQRMEAYDGVTILATNLRSNLDSAFTRRLQFVIDFPFPDEQQRLLIWENLFPLDVPRATDLDFKIMARRFKLAGGNIRNILVSAAYQAASDGGCVRMEHLLHGARRELQKMGLHVVEADMTIPTKSN